MNTMDKPSTILKEELNTNIVNIINTCDLPMFVVEYVLKDIMNEVHSVAVKQFKNDLNAYNASLENGNPEESNEDSEE